MPKTQIRSTQDPAAHHTSSRALIRRFLPYLAKGRSSRWEPQPVAVA